MQEQLIPHELLQKSDRILFLTHLAIGDFTYMQNYFKEFSAKYPHLKIDLWVDEGRGKSILCRWKKQSNYILYDWLKSCSFFNKIYKNTASWWQLKKILKEAKKQNYPIVVSLTIFRRHRYAKYARKITSKGFCAAIGDLEKKRCFIKNYYLKKINKLVGYKIKVFEKQSHITNHYANWFDALFNLKVEREKRYPFVDIPKVWLCNAKLKFLKWGINEKQRTEQKTIFINSFAKTEKRCWTRQHVIELIGLLRQYDDFYNTNFVINVMPDKYKDFEKGLKNYSARKIFLFTAANNYFQLPAILSLCDLVISVETSIIHLASAVHVPVLALMRQKNPEWVPLGSNNKVIYAKKRGDWVKDIYASDVAQQAIAFYESSK
jgi:heptosyltransferase III